jgi:hypothetical protein
LHGPAGSKRWNNFSTSFEVPNSLANAKFLAGSSLTHDNNNIL